MLGERITAIISLQVKDNEALFHLTLKTIVTVLLLEAFSHYSLRPR